jgi:transcription-repair coupling factor (superfamily II helicase)
VGVFEGHLNAARITPSPSSPCSPAAAKTRPRRRRPGQRTRPFQPSDITPGDYVVHQNHGIGVYAGIQRLDLQGVEKD